ncbi:MAG: hypothetical protein HY297_01840 [Thaumarchaeota archaeon]|nr:hypothetical protein [Nitrososphaerota archaeon]
MILSSALVTSLFVTLAATNVPSPPPTVYSESYWASVATFRTFVELAEGFGLVAVLLVFSSFSPKLVRKGFGLTFTIIGTSIFITMAVIDVLNNVPKAMNPFFDAARRLIYVLGGGRSTQTTQGVYFSVWKRSRRFYLPSSGGLSIALTHGLHHGPVG